MTVKRTLCLTVALLVFSLFSGLGFKANSRLNVGYSAASADQLPAWVAKETGIFAKNSLDIQLIFFTGGTTAILALVSGDVPITQVSGPGLVNSVFAGSDAVFVAAGISLVELCADGKAGNQERASSSKAGRWRSAVSVRQRIPLHVLP